MSAPPSAACFSFLPEAKAAAAAGKLGATLERWAAEQRSYSAPQAANLLRLIGSAAAEGFKVPPGVLPRLAGSLATASRPLTPFHISSAIRGLRAQPESPEVRTVLLRLARHLELGEEPLPTRSVAAALYGMQHRKVGPECVAVLCGLIPRLPLSGALDSQAVGNALYGLQYLYGAGQWALQVLGRLAPTIRPVSLEAGDAAAALYGFHSVPDSDAARSALAALAEAVGRGTDGYGVQEVSMALYGLRGQPDVLPVRWILEALAPRVAACTGTFTGQGVASALYGLRWQGSSRPVQRMLEVLAGQVARCAEPIEAAQLAPAIYGLQGDKAPRAVCAVLAALTPFAAACPSFSSRSLSVALYGLYGLTDQPEVQDLLRALTPGIAACRGALEPRDIAMALYGFRGQRTAPAVRGALAALAPRILLQSGRMRDAHIGMAVYGLHGQSDCMELRLLLRFLTAQLESSPLPLTPVIASQCLQSLAVLGGSKVRTQRALRCVMLRLPPDCADHQGLCQAMALVGAEHRVRKDEPQRKAPMAPGVNATERAVLVLLEHAGIPELQFNVTHGPTGIEFDILCGGVCIELDSGTSAYRAEGKRRLQDMRTLLLGKRYGIAVRRVSLTGRQLGDVVRDIAAACPPLPAADEAWHRARRLAARGWEAAYARGNSAARRMRAASRAA